MRRVTRTIVEINSESGVRLILAKNEPNQTVMVNAFFNDQPIHRYELTRGDALELSQVLREFTDE